MVWWNFILCSFGSRVTEKYAELKCQHSGQLFIAMAVLNLTATSTFMYFYEDIVALVSPVVSSALKQGLDEIAENPRVKGNSIENKSVFLYSGNQLL